MFEMNELQKKLNEAFQKAQAEATVRAREVEQEARKVLETLGDRAQAELKVMVAQARTASMEQIGSLGVELEKLGKKLQEMATAPVAAGNQTQPAPTDVQ